MLDNVLKAKIEKLCEDIKAQHFESYPSLTDYGVTFKKGRKFVKIIITDANGSNRSVWGFINLTHDKFKIGDVLKAAGWAAPALNHARGNVIDGYKIDARRMYGPNYMFEGV
jgi:hypothetical protein|tara:strand:+ start:185 stop:520 length:336 start_codon:yes stop_codon:yes gene_type:complete